MCIHYTIFSNLYEAFMQLTSRKCSCQTLYACGINTLRLPLITSLYNPENNAITVESDQQPVCLTTPSCTFTIWSAVPVHLLPQTYIHHLLTTILAYVGVMRPFIHPDERGGSASVGGCLKGVTMNTGYRGRTTGNVEHDDYNGCKSRPGFHFHLTSME